MARRELGGASKTRHSNGLLEAHMFFFAGVVSSTLNVHGTANLRVADASIIPMPVATHIQGTVYAIGEKVAPVWFVLLQF